MRKERMTLGRWRAGLLLVALVVLATIAVSVAGASDGESKKSYIVVMAQDPALAYEGGEAGIPATKPAEGEKIDADSAAVRQYQEHLERKHDESLAKADVPVERKVHDYGVAVNGYSALLTEEEAEAIDSQKSVLKVMEDELRQATTDSSPGFLGLTGRRDAWGRGIDGRGVVVGVIDTGIWPEHPSFADDGSYPEPPANVPPTLPCEFGNTAHNPNDVAFTCQNKLLGARQMLATYRAVLGAESWEYRSARDDDGHGTHTASTAAGNAGVEATILGEERGEISGIAPRAHVIAYKGLGAQGGFGSDLAAAIDTAVLDGVDVINYSIGGGASLTGIDDIAFLFAADSGLFVASSSGNSGPGPATVGGPASVPWLTAVGASTQERFFPGTVQLGNGQRYHGASVSITERVGYVGLVDAANAGGELCAPGTLNSAIVVGKIVLCKRGVVGRVEKSAEVLRAGGVGMIMYEASDVGNLFTDTHFVPTVHIDNTPGLAIKAYAAKANARARLLPGETRRGGGDDDDDDDGGRRSFSSRSDDDDDDDDDGGGSSSQSKLQRALADGEWPFAPSMVDFSSRGPNPVAESIIKPDVTAPGIQILAGASPTPPPGAAPAGQLFQAIAGTSMSSPHVAGLYALIKQAHPDWSAAAAKSALMTTADDDVLDNDRRSDATPFGMGAGHVNLGRPDRRGSAFQPGLVYDAGFNEYLGFLCEAGPEVFANPAATCALLEGAGIPTRAVDLNLASIGISQVAGVETIERTVTSVADRTQRYRVDVDEPDGYDVDVSPSSFELAPGASQTYEVTFTNESAPAGEWRFGSLEWRGGDYRVQSPIAVRGSKFSAPDELELTGASGTGSFDIKFGYTGAYAAQAHGLVSATLTNAVVGQDPNQEFDPSDVPVGANAHTFALSNAGVLRVAIPPEATEVNADLDVFVYDPSGEQVASSTLGGTDEEVTIQDPANGTWTVYVHGWQAPGGSSPYTMYSWVIPNAPGGNLTIGSAPTSATTGQTGTINFSWTGAGATWNLGAVSHNEGSTIFGRTLIEVDNRP
jgi:subtilisin family serine protease